MRSISTLVATPPTSAVRTSCFAPVIRRSIWRMRPSSATTCSATGRIDRSQRPSTTQSTSLTPRPGSSPLTSKRSGRIPGREQITAPIEAWLATLNPDVVLRSARESVPSRQIEFDGWDISLWAYPVSPEHRGKADHQVLGSHSEGMSVLEDAVPIRSKLKKKASRYGDMDRPYLVGLLCAGDFADDCDIAAALLGKTLLRFHVASGHAEPVREPDGFWWGPKGPQNTRVSGVLTVPQLNCGSITSVEPTLWLSPWAQRPFTISMPWRTQRITTCGHFELTEATRRAADILPKLAWPLEAQGAGNSSRWAAASISRARSN